MVTVDRMPYRWQFCANGYDITHEVHAEQDTDTVRAWAGAHGDTCVVEVTRTPRGRWRISASDLRLPVSEYRRRFRSPIGAVEYIAGLARMTAVEAVCRCGEPRSACG